jgi:2,5-furandicarboxylate decarboxylase 1
MVKDFREFVKELESNRELIRVKEELGTRFEISAATSILRKRGNKAILFERVKGYDSPVVSNLLGSKKRFAIAMGVKEEQVEETYLLRKENLIKPETREIGPTDEVVIEKDIDILQKIPILTHHERDAGPYLTAAITVAKDPKTGARGMGVHRVQIKGKDKVGIFLFNPPLSDFFSTAEKLGRPLEVAIITGVHPIILMSSILTVPGGIDKLEIAGGLLQRPVDLSRCKTVDLEVPAPAEFILEGEVLPNKREKEGPFGESTGFYFTYNNPVAKIRAIRYRKGPIYQALVPFGGEDFALVNLVWGLEQMQEVKKRFPSVQDVLFKGMNYMAIVQIDKTSDDQADDIADYLLKNPHTKIIIFVDKDVDIYSSQEVSWAVCTRMRATSDIHVRDGLPGMIIDPSVNGEIGTDPSTSKLVIDATMPLEHEKRYEKIAIPGSIKDKVGAIMAKYVTF